MQTAFYYLGLASLFTHELDAVHHTEWRLLYFLRDMADENAYPIFVGLHLPLFAILLWLSHHRNAKLRDRFRLAVAAFLVVHAGIHLRLTGSPGYEFSGPLSNLLIYSAALFGVAFAISVWRDRVAGSSVR